MFESYWARRTVMKTLGWTTASAWLIASACGGKAIIDGTPGSGAAGNGGNGGASTSSSASATSSVTSTVSSSTGSACVDSPNCNHCKDCLQGGCGTVAAPKNLCKCNGTMGPSSQELYQSFFGCICGNDGHSGKCGPLCSKTCAGAFTDSGTCMSCLGGALAGPCKSSLLACNSDN